jgi:hypothetical protein
MNRFLFVNVLVLVSALSACGRKVECTSEVLGASASYKVTARGEGEEGPIMKIALRDACQKMCVETKSPMIDSCTARCVVDAGAQKIGARTTCKK